MELAQDRVLWRAVMLTVLNMVFWNQGISETDLGQIGYEVDWTGSGSCSEADVEHKAQPPETL